MRMLIINEKSSPLAIANLLNSVRRMSDDIILIGNIEELKGLEVDVHSINHVDHDHIKLAEMELKNSKKDSISLKL